MTRDVPTLVRWLVRLLAIGFLVTIGASLLERVEGPLPWT